jgi:hypothetical protein
MERKEKPFTIVADIHKEYNKLSASEKKRLQSEAVAISFCSDVGDMGEDDIEGGKPTLLHILALHESYEREIDNYKEYFYEILSLLDDWEDGLTELVAKKTLRKIGSIKNKLNTITSSLGEHF